MEQHRVEVVGKTLMSQRINLLHSRIAHFFRTTVQASSR